MATFAEAAAAIGAFGPRANLGAEAAANEMASVFRPVVQRVLRARSHAFATKTPSPPGSPPAAISGALAASIMNEPAASAGDGIWESKSGPTTRYGRIQELGGEMSGHPTMFWHENGIPHWSHRHSLPPRPYLAPVADAMSANGELSDASAGAFGAVVDGG